MSIEVKCRHCKRLVPPSNIPGRGLCRGCYKRTPIRQKYPPTVAKRKGVPQDPCRHCGRKVSIHSLANYRGMCHACRADPEIRTLYPGPMTDPCCICDRCGLTSNYPITAEQRFCRVCLDVLNGDPERLQRDTAILNAVRCATPNPTSALQGTPERIGTYAARIEKGLPLFGSDREFDWRRDEENNNG